MFSCHTCKLQFCAISRWTLYVYPGFIISYTLVTSDVRRKICPENFIFFRKISENFHRIFPENFPMFFYKYNIIKYNNFTLLKRHYKLSYLIYIISYATDGATWYTVHKLKVKPQEIT